MQGISSTIAMDELKELLRSNAILRSAPGQPIQLPNGQLAPWMFYSWNVTMTPRGARLVAECMLERLRTFEATQLATLGYTCMPILSGCLLLGGDRYTGLCVRKERKAHGSMRRIDGTLDRSRPVVVMDDSIVSATSVLQAIEAIEAEGARVEGVLGLISFPYGGLERLRALGYRAEVLFDIHSDLGLSLGEFVPGHVRATPAQWGNEQVPDRLHPATAARRIAQMYLQSREVPRPPRSLDREYDGRGGVFVSFRRRDSDYRVGRDGFWHFNPEDADACRDLVLATVQTVAASQGQISLETLPSLKINATFFTPLEKITPSRLNFWTHGIVVRSRQLDFKMGGALPNTQYFSDEIEQYRHARETNARIGPNEPHDVFRHSLTKCVEPGETWLPYGFPYNADDDWGRNEEIGRQLTARAVQLLRSFEKATKPPPGHVSNGLIPCPVYTVGVTLYHRGIVGCGLAWSDPLDVCLRRAAETAWNDDRYAEQRAGLTVDDVTVAVSILWGQERIGEVPIEQASAKMRRGIDSISVMHGRNRAIFLPVVSVYHNWSKQQTAQELLRKAGITAPVSAWATYQTHTWLRRGDEQWKSTFGFVDRAEMPHDPSQWGDDARLLARYVHGQMQPDGLPTYYYFPVTGQRIARGSSARVVHAIGALEEAGRVLENADWRDAGLQALRKCLSTVQRPSAPIAGLCQLPGEAGSPTTDAILLSAVCNAGDAALLDDEATHSLARGLRTLRQDDGRIVSVVEMRGVNADHDYMPGQVLLALARWANVTRDHSVLSDIDAHLDFFRRRFHIAHPWGMVGWQTQAWTAIHRLTSNPSQAAFVFELADWALDRQSETHGAFLTDLHPYGLSFHTAFIIEGIADAWELAIRVGDSTRADRYARSCHAAMRFMNRLYIRREDTFCVAEPDVALGAVRGALSVSDARIDYTSHTLFALLKCLELRTRS